MKTSTIRILVRSYSGIGWCVIDYAHLCCNCIHMVCAIGCSFYRLWLGHFSLVRSNCIVYTHLFVLGHSKKLILTWASILTSNVPIEGMLLFSTSHLIPCFVSWFSATHLLGTSTGGWQPGEHATGHIQRRSTYSSGAVVVVSSLNRGGLESPPPAPAA